MRVQIDVHEDNMIQKEEKYIFAMEQQRIDVCFLKKNSVFGCPILFHGKMKNYRCVLNEIDAQNRTTELIDRIRLVSVIITLWSIFFILFYLFDIEDQFDLFLFHTITYSSITI